MADRQTEMRLANLAGKKRTMQDRIRKKRDKIEMIEDSIYKMEEQVQNIDDQIMKIRLTVAKEEEKQQKQQKQQQAQGDVAEVEESDAGTTTGGLDASSVSDGGPSGWKGGDWRVRPKIGKTTKRHKSKCSDKKKKKVYESFIDNWNSEGE